jgi:hypothetical protein
LLAYAKQQELQLMAPEIHIGVEEPLWSELGWCSPKSSSMDKDHVLTISLVFSAT